MTKKTLKADLSISSIRNLQKQLQDYQKDLTKKCEEFVRRLAEKGVEIAKMKIADYDAIYTGELLASINSEQGAVIQNGATWIVYTNCPWAKFVEFGTGIVGEHSPHPNTSIVGWKYDANEHGEKGWFYFRDGEWHWTKGMPSRPFMHETAMDLRKEIVKTAKDVFGK